MEKPSKLTTKKLIIIIAAVVVVCGLALGALVFSRNRIKEVASDNEYGYVNPDETKAETDAGFKIDGVLDEEQYKNNNWLYLSNKEGGANVDIAMTSYYGDKGMYFVYDVTEGNPIYVNTARASYLNSCIEMYLAPSTVTSLGGNSIFEIDLLPTGDMTFKKSNGKGGYVNVATTNDKMAVLGATTKGGEVNSEECYGYCLELFIPWDYMDKFDLDSDAMRDSFVYVDPAHITSFNFAGTDTNVDRYWYYFAQQHGAGFSDVYQYFRFDEDGVQGTVPVELQEGSHYTIEGATAVIPGMKTNVTITPEAGYALNSILINGEEYIKKANFNEDGSVTINERGVKGGVKISASAVLVTEGNKTLTGTVVANKLGGGSLKDVSASYTGPTGEKPLELDSKGKFTLTDLKQGYYTITIEKEGYEKLVRSIYVNRDMEVELSLEYQTFAVTKGSCWILDDQNDGILNKFGGSGNLMSNDSYNKFTVEANFKFDKDLPEEADTDAFTQQRQGLRIEFSNEKTWHVDVMNENGKYIVQYAKHTGDKSVFGWKGIHEMTEAEVKKFTSEDGIKLSVERDGKYANVYLDGKLIAVEVLADEYEKLTAKIGFEFWVANREIMEVPYKIVTKNSVNLRSGVFKMAKEWDLTGQYNGLLKIPNCDGDAGWIGTLKNYQNIDLTLNVKDYVGNKTEFRHVVKFTFENKETVAISLTYADGEYKIQSMGDTLYGWRSHHLLTDEQIEKLQSKDGIDLRIVRIGTEMTLYLDGESVAICDLTTNRKKEATGITADMPAEIAMRHYGNEGHTVEMPFSVTETPDIVTINRVKSDKGAVVTDKQNYVAGDTVVVTGSGKDYYMSGLKHNGKEVTMNWDGSYSFKVASGETHNLEGIYDIRYFKDSEKWNTLKQGSGLLVVPKEITSTQKDADGNLTGDAGWIETSKAYDDVDLKLTLKDQKSEDNNYRMAVHFAFANEEVLRFSLTNADSGEVGTYKIQVMGSNTIVKNWSTPYRLSEEEVDALTGGEGLEMRVVRVGDVVDVYLGGAHIYEFDLAKDLEGEATEIADKTAVVSLRHYGNAEQEVQIPFAITKAPEVIKITVEENDNATIVPKDRNYFVGDTVELVGVGEEYYCYAMTVDGAPIELAWNGIGSFVATKNEHTVVGSYAKKVFKDNDGWNLVEQNNGVISLPQDHTKNSTWLDFYNKYTDIDLTITARDYVKNNTETRQLVLFTFENGKKAAFSITCSAGTYGIQSMGEIYGYKWFYQPMNTSELAEYQGENGMDFRVVRSGTNVFLYLGDKRLGEAIDLTKDKDGNPTEITADMEATVTLRNYGNEGHEVVMPFTVTDEVTVVELEHLSSDHGKLSTQYKNYIVGDTVNVTEEGDEGYYCYKMEIDGAQVTLNTDRSYSFEATKAKHTLKGYFDKKVFQDKAGWNLVKQNEGVISLPASRTGNADWVDFYNKYTDIDLTVTARDYVGNKTKVRTVVQFTFENKKTASFSVTYSDNEYKIQSMGDTTFGWGKHYDLSSDEVEKYQSAAGVDLRIVRSGTDVFLYLDGKRIGEALTLTQKSSGITADMKATVSIKQYDNFGHEVVIPFTVTDEVTTVNVDIAENIENGTVSTQYKKYILNDEVVLNVTPSEKYNCTGLTVKQGNDNVTLDKEVVFAGGAYKFTATKTDYDVNAEFTKKIFVDNDGWNLLNQYEGVVSLPSNHTTNSSYLEFVEKYNDFDLTLTARDYLKDNNQEISHTVRMVFSDGTNSYDVRLRLSHNNNTWGVQSMGGLYNYKWFYATMTPEQINAYQSADGLDYRIVRKGTEIYLYLGEERVCEVLDLSEKGITKDMSATVYIRTDGNAGMAVEVPFAMTSTVPKTVNIDGLKDNKNGTVSTEYSKYLVGDAVVLTVKPNEQYHCTQLTVKHGTKTIELDKDVVLAGGDYSFVATEDSYTVDAAFAKAIFTDESWWNLEEQHKGLISVKTTQDNGHSHWLYFADKYTDMDLTITVKEYLNESTDTSELTRTTIQFQMAGMTANFGIAKDKVGDGFTYRIISLNNDSVVSGNRVYYVLTEEEISKVKDNGIEFRVVREGTTVDLYLDGRLVYEDMDLTHGGQYAITETTAATVGIRRLDDKGVKVEIPFVLRDRDEIFVSAKDGEDVASNGSSEQPYKTLAYAFTQAKDGDVIYIKDDLTIANNDAWKPFSAELVKGVEVVKDVVITSDTADAAVETVDFSALSTLSLNANVIFRNIKLKLPATVYAEGNHVVIEDSVELLNGNNEVTIYGGSNAKDVKSTNLELYAGSYLNIYGGGNTKNVLEDSKVVVGEGVNADSNVNYTSEDHTHTYMLFGGCKAGTVKGDTYVIVGKNAEFMYIYGGGHDASSLVEGTTNVEFEGNAMSIYGGSMNGTNADTHIEMIGGNVYQVFGGCESNSMIGNTDVQILGGKVLRRIYGGCYNNFNENGWSNPARQVTGYTNVEISPEADILLNKDSDNALCAISRYSTTFANEWGTLIFRDGSYDEDGSKISGFRLQVIVTLINQQPYHYLVKAGVGGDVTSAGNVINIAPDEGKVAKVTISGKENAIYYTTAGSYELPNVKATDKVTINVTFGDYANELVNCAAKLGTVYYEDAYEAIEIAEKTGVSIEPIKAEIGTVTINNGENGTVTSPHKYYVVGDEITLKITPNSGYYQNVRVNSEKIVVEDDGTYTFNTTETETIIEGKFAAGLFNSEGSWDLTNQYGGQIAQKNTVTGNAGWLTTVRTDYKDVDVIVNVNNEAIGDTITNASRTSVQFGYKADGHDFWTSFSILQSGDTYIITNRNGDNVPFTTYTLTADEVNLLKSEAGIDFRVSRRGTLVSLYLNNQLRVENIDLTKGSVDTSYITSETPMQIKFKQDDDPNARVVIPFAIYESVSVDIATVSNGQITANKSSCLYGDDVTLTVKGNDGYYYDSLIVNGKEVTTNLDGNYTFKATEEVNRIRGSFTTEIFVENNNWKLVNQNKGIIAQSNAVTGNASWLMSRRLDYKDVDVTVNVKDAEAGDTKTKDSRTSVQFGYKADGHDFWTSFSILQSGDTYIITNRNGDNVPFTTYTLTADEANLLKSEAGIDFRVSRRGTLVNLYLNNQLRVENIDLTKGSVDTSYITSETPMQIKIKRDDDPNALAVIKYEIKE